MLKYIVNINILVCAYHSKELNPATHKNVCDDNIVI